MDALNKSVNTKPNGVLAALRRHLNLSHKRFAKTIDRTGPLIYMIEQGRRRLTRRVAAEVWDRHARTLRRMGYRREDLHSDPR